MYALLLLVSRLALAQDEAPPPAPEPLPTQKPPRQWRWAALPVANFSSTYGLGYGAYANIVNNGKGDLGDDPYRARIAVQYYRTTGSYQDHFLQLDFPSVWGSKFRWDMQAGYNIWDTATYFGEGNDLPRIAPPTVDANGAAVEAEPCVPDGSKAYAANGDVGASAEGVPPACYYNYGQRGFKINTNLRRPLTGPWEGFSNLYVRQFDLRTYKDSIVDLTKPQGYQGGWYTRAGLGVMLDTRDKEPSPTSGMFSEGSVRLGRLFGDEDLGPMVGVNLTDRRFLGLGQEKRLVLASRVILDMKWGDEPFFMAATVGGSQDNTLGTSTLLRGVNSNRWQGDGIAAWTPEVRWNVVSPHIGSNVLDIMVGPYFDVARVWVWPDETTTDAAQDDPLHLHYAGGVASRFVWNTNMVVRLDFGFGAEEYYVDADGDGLPDGENTEKQPNFGLFLVFDHPY